MRITGESVVVATRDQVSCELSEEAVILHLEDGVYYGLNAVGARVWDLIQKPLPVAALVRAVVEEYEVDRDRCERDVIRLLERLVSSRLAEIREGAPT